MCDFREAELIEQIEQYQRIINLHALPVMVCRSAGSIVDSGLTSLIKHLQGLEPDTLIMVNIKSINCCDMATISSPAPIANDCNGHSVYATTGRVTFAENVEITASEFVHLLNKGDME
jgi:hypothetical protein